MALVPETFLELCQDLVKESPISGDFTTVSATGTGTDFERVVNWVATATLEIETAYLNWNFLSETFNTFDTIIDITDYPVPADWNWWDHSAFAVPADEQPLDFIDWNRQKHDLELVQSGDPLEFTILPDGTVRLKTKPTTIDTIRAPYWKQATVLANNADEPLIPKRYRKVITYRALKLYAEYESNDEINEKAKNGLAFWLPSLQSKELPANQGFQRVNTGTDIQVTSPEVDNLSLLDNFFT